MVVVGQGLSDLIAAETTPSVGLRYRFNFNIIQSKKKKKAEIENWIIKAHQMQQMMHPITICKSSPDRFIRRKAKW